MGLLTEASKVPLISVISQTCRNVLVCRACAEGDHAVLSAARVNFIANLHSS